MSAGGAAAALGLTPEVLRGLERLTLPSRRAVLGASAGQRRSLRYGSSLDLADYRSYVAGDDIRRLDWSAYARLGRLFVRLYAGEEDACVTLWVDTSASMAWDPAGKERPARAIAGALAYLSLVAEDRAACIGFADSVVGWAGPVRGRRAAPRLWTTLAELPRGGPTDWAAIAAAARWMPKGVAVVLSDFLTVELPKEALAALRSAGHEVVLVQVLSPEELRPSLRGDLRLVDSETFRSVEVTLGQGPQRLPGRQSRAHEAAVLACSVVPGAPGHRGRRAALRQLLLGQLVRARVVR